MSWYAIQVESGKSILRDNSFGVFLSWISGLVSPAAGFAVAVRPSPWC
jgi:hypothetical protein